MPYISNKYGKRSAIRDRDRLAITPGELNYLITSLVNEYLGYHGLNYDGINEVVGALECAKLELYRRVAAPYEDKKIAENGDVYNPALLTED